jgi:hypothetical protein
VSAEQVQRLRELCLALPAVTERASHGEPAFFVRVGAAKDKQFVMLDDHHHGAAHLGFWCAAAAGAQEELIAADPQRFYRPPYVGHRGWVGMRIDDPGTDWDEVGEIVREAFRQVAPATLSAQLDR